VTDVSAGSELQDLARQHLWMQYTPMTDYVSGTRRVPIIVRGEGCYVYDDQDRRYLDGLSGLFCVNLGHGRTEIADAIAAQASTLAYAPNWSRTHPAAVRLAARMATLAPGDLNRVFFTSGGSEAVESSIKLARQYHKLNGHPNKIKVIAREGAYHGTTFGALSATGLRSSREPFEPLVPGGCHVPATNLYRRPPGFTDNDFAEAVAHRIAFEGPETVAAVILEPIQSSGGCLTPPPGYFNRVREICDEAGVLLISDEIVCAWGRLGHWYGCERFGYQPDMVVAAKGLTSGYAPLGAVVASERVFAPFAKGPASFDHGFTFAGHPLACAAALANLDVYEQEGINEHVREHEGVLADMLESLRDIPLVGDVRGGGYFRALELVKSRESKESFDAAGYQEPLRRLISDPLVEGGLFCRWDTRGDPIVQLAPPLIAGRSEIEAIESVLRPVLEKASRQLIG
jgi:adenosylmethionine-8-amino-7-oxononanoate aminotransferase